MGLGLLLASVAGPAVARTPENVAEDVSRNIMSPYCEGLTLHDCPSGEAQDLREQIESWARDGMTKTEIIDRLADEYGESIRAVPEAEGVGVLVWLLPLAALAGGTAVAVVAARRWAGRRTPMSRTKITDEERAWLQADLEVERTRSDGPW